MAEKQILAAWTNDEWIHILDLSGSLVRSIKLKVLVNHMVVEGHKVFVFNGEYSPANNRFCEIVDLDGGKSSYYKISPTKIMKPFPKKLMDLKKKVFVRANMLGGKTVLDSQVILAPGMTQNTVMFKNKKVKQEWVFPFKYINTFDYKKTDYAPDFNINRTTTTMVSRSINYDLRNYVTQVIAAGSRVYGVYQIAEKKEHFANLLFCYDKDAGKLLWHKEYNNNLIYLLMADTQSVSFYDYQQKHIEVLSFKL